MAAQVTFNEEKIASRRTMSNPKGITGFIIRISGGSIQNAVQANMVMIVVVIVLFTASFFVFSSSAPKTPELVAPPGYKVVTPENQPPRLEREQ